MYIYLATNMCRVCEIHFPQRIKREARKHKLLHAPCWKFPKRTISVLDITSIYMAKLGGGIRRAIFSPYIQTENFTFWKELFTVSEYIDIYIHKYKHGFVLKSESKSKYQMCTYISDGTCVNFSDTQKKLTQQCV